MDFSLNSREEDEPSSTNFNILLFERNTLANLPEYCCNPNCSANCLPNSPAAFLRERLFFALDDVSSVESDDSESVPSEGDESSLVVELPLLDDETDNDGDGDGESYRQHTTQHMSLHATHD